MKQKRDKKAFSALVKENQAVIHKITMVYENTRSGREDLFQEICLQLWKAYPGFREEARFSTWLYRVALNTAISDVRKRKNVFAFEPLRESDHITPETSRDHEYTQHLHSAISKLNRIDKAIILLWLEDKSYQDIAAIIGTSKNNISVKLVRIKRKLEEMINPSPGQES
jgi:RNA polymerase sigma-70 factor (ECF subfamily)